MRPTSAGCLLLLVLWTTCIAKDTSDYRAGSLAKQEVQAIYAADPRDAWNLIFFLLFTRTVELRLTGDFKEAGPFSPTMTMGNDSLPVTTHTFQRIESGDQAIDPLYPNFLTSKGAESVLVEPQFSELKRALNAACAETIPRPPLHRALMQSDVWAAYDVLNWFRDDHGQLGARARELLPLLDQFISKLSLTSQEIAALPRNYLTAQRRLDLPELFDERSGWMEVEWFSSREHDASADYRRAVQASSLDGAALVTEALLIERKSGRVVPSPLTYEVQLRTFVKDAQGNAKSTTIVQCELNRKLLLKDPTSGGLIPLTADQPAYLPSSGNDYTFAPSALGKKTVGLPILGNLRRRCESCHSADAALIFTFLVNPGPNTPPLIRRLRPADDEHASYVAKEKMKKSNFKSLHLTR